ncbi:MAG: helix-turn-helix domain-containing protein [Eubacterium sp.]|nr:helix-turn-helix domain-containing protein [Eubacterium sp.]
MKIGEKIIELRKAKKLTQEQLADMLGVSAPAVSKWETDSSYPDITMLCPLARALGTNVDTLLSYEETLSDEKQGQYMTEVVEMIRAGKTEEAEERVEWLLHSYPSSVPLKFSAVAAFSLLEMSDVADGEGAAEKKQRWTARKKELAEAMYQSGESAFYMPALAMLITLELTDGNLERAEKLLQETVTNTADFTMLWVKLYQQKGDKDKVLSTIQSNLYKLVGEVQNCLLLLLEEDMGFDRERTLAICDVLCKMEELYVTGGGAAAGAIAEVYLRLGMEEEALEYLERFADRITTPAPINQVLFAPTFSSDSLKTGFTRELRLVVINGLEQDACYDKLRGEERFQAIVRKLKDYQKSEDK